MQRTGISPRQVAPTAVYVRLFSIKDRQSDTKRQNLKAKEKGESTRRAPKQKARKQKERKKERERYRQAF